MTVTATTKSPSFLTGRKVLLMLGGFFGVMFTVNGYMAYQAITTFRGADTDSVYNEGRAFPAEMEAARKQAALGWDVTVHADRNAAGEARLILSPRDKAGAPVSGLLVEARLEHPSNRYLDKAVTLVEGESGTYSGTAAGVSAGIWDVVVEAKTGEIRLYRSRNRLILN